MKRALILGAGGFGREMLGYLKKDPDCGRIWEICGFLDDNEQALDGFRYSEKVIGRIDSYVPDENDVLVCALGSPDAKKRICPSLVGRGARFLTYIHPTAIIGEHVVIGTGCVLAPFVALTADIVLSDFVTLNARSGCGHDVRIGDYSTLSAYCDLTGGVELGEGVFMGSHATVVPKRKIGAGAYIGAGSVVATHIKPGQKVFGVPAKSFM